ncbi:hypothetical protein O1611_g6128 [Lasiodiplodia mahajangana]|uniref:Uncharacterized protein n=1 Tax=Lasiodiplodia mahajangana TaxID=1108764 RepID=A0ACC2JJH9_9PEZI|nr:hypothetical protein O1611_g6128 [Lasiodiplodia mahajangana]
MSSSILQHPLLNLAFQPTSSQLDSIVPADAGTATVDKLESLTQAVIAMQQSIAALQKSTAAIVGDVNGLKNQICASNYNSIVRVRNTLSTSPEHPLRPLRAIDTNTPIAGFPQTIGDLDMLDSPTLNRILAALNAPIDGTALTRRTKTKDSGSYFRGYLVGDR